MDKNRKIRLIIYDILGVLLTSVIFLIPFYFLVNSSFKSVKEAYRMELNLPSSFHIIENFKEVLQVQNGIVIRAFINSLIITIFSVLGLVIVCSKKKKQTFRIVEFYDIVGVDSSSRHCSDNLGA